MSEQDGINPRRERAIDAYQRERRFRAIVQHIVHAAVEKSGVLARDETVWRPRDVADFAEDVAAQVLQMVYENDMELAAQKAMADQFRKIAEEALSIRPIAPVVTEARLPDFAAEAPEQ